MNTPIEHSALAHDSAHGPQASKFVTQYLTDTTESKQQTVASSEEAACDFKISSMWCGIMEIVLK